MTPRAPQAPSKTVLGTDFNRFWTPNSWILGFQLGGFWKDFASHLEAFFVVAWLVVRMDG